MTDWTNVLAGRRADRYNAPVTPGTAVEGDTGITITDVPGVTPGTYFSDLQTDLQAMFANIADGTVWIYAEDPASLLTYKWFEITTSTPGPSPLIRGVVTSAPTSGFETDWASVNLLPAGEGLLVGESGIVPPINGVDVKRGDVVVSDGTGWVLVSTGELPPLTTAEDVLTVIDPTTGQIDWRPPTSVRMFDPTRDYVTGNLVIAGTSPLQLFRASADIAAAPIAPNLPGADPLWIEVGSVGGGIDLWLAGLDWDEGDMAATVELGGVLRLWRAATAIANDQIEPGNPGADAAWTEVRSHPTVMATMNAAEPPPTRVAGTPVTWGTTGTDEGEIVVTSSAGATATSFGTEVGIMQFGNLVSLGAILEAEPTVTGAAASPAALLEAGAAALLPYPIEAPAVPPPGFIGVQFDTATNRIKFYFGPVEIGGGFNPAIAMAPLPYLGRTPVEGDTFLRVPVSEGFIWGESAGQMQWLPLQAPAARPPEPFDSTRNYDTGDLVLVPGAQPDDPYALYRAEAPVPASANPPGDPAASADWVQVSAIATPGATVWDATSVYQPGDLVLTPTAAGWQLWRADTAVLAGPNAPGTPQAPAGWVPLGSTQVYWVDADADVATTIAPVGSILVVDDSTDRDHHGDVYRRIPGAVTGDPDVWEPIGQILDMGTRNVLDDIAATILSVGEVLLSMIGSAPSEWDATLAYPADSVVHHAPGIWIANADTVAGDEPGVTASWRRISLLDLELPEQTAPGVLTADGVGGVSWEPASTGIFVGTTTPVGAVPGSVWLVIPDSNVASNAIVGAPGSWAPATARPPATPAELAAIVAGAAWTTQGQYVVDANGHEWYWDGTRWQGGRVPAPAAVTPTNVVEGSPGSFTPVGSTVPVSLAALQLSGITGTTAWTGDTWVALGTGTAWWDGVTWQAGHSPDPSTTATAGAPGTFDADTPADFAALTALLPNPATSWPQGDYVVTGDGNEWWWDGGNFLPGRSPAPPPSDRTVTLDPWSAGAYPQSPDELPDAMKLYDGGGNGQSFVWSGVQTPSRVREYRIEIFNTGRVSKWHTTHTGWSNNLTLNLSAAQRPAYGDQIVMTLTYTDGTSARLIVNVQ